MTVSETGGLPAEDDGPAGSPGLRPRRRVVIAIAAAVAVLAVVGAVAIVRHDDPSRLDRAVNIADDDSRWTTTRKASDAMGEITDLLFAEAKGCDQEQPSCVALYQAIGFTQVGGVFVLKCTSPGVFDLRGSTRRYLPALRATVERGAPPPDPIVIPSC